MLERLVLNYHTLVDFPSVVHENKESLLSRSILLLLGERGVARVRCGSTEEQSLPWEPLPLRTLMFGTSRVYVHSCCEPSGALWFQQLWKMAFCLFGCPPLTQDVPTQNLSCHVDCPKMIGLILLSLERFS